MGILRPNKIISIKNLMKDEVFMIIEFNVRYIGFVYLTNPFTVLFPSLTNG